MLFLALGEPNFEFRTAFGPMQIERNECETLAFNGADKPIQLVALQQ